MEPGLFEDLLASVREAGAILRGKMEAARRTRLENSNHPTVAIPGGPGVPGSTKGEK